MKKKKIQVIINIMLGILFLFQVIISYEGKISFWPGLLLVFGILELVFAFLTYKDDLK